MLGKLIETLRPDYWPRIPSRLSIGCMAAILAFITYAMAAWGWVPLLSGTTLLIHESGHLIVGLVLGDRMMVYGGTILQLVFPLVFALHFMRQGHVLGYCFSWGWQASSFRSVAIYAADAREQALPLVGNGDRIHDWNDILGRWGALKLDHLIGYGFTLFAWIALAGMACLLFRLWLAAE